MKKGVAYYIEYNFTELSITTHDNILVQQEKLMNKQRTIRDDDFCCDYQNFVAITLIAIL